MNTEGVYEPGDTLTLPDGTQLVAELASRDGSGCFCCDNGKEQCFFQTSNEPCPKCHSDRFGCLDYVGHRVVFLPKQ